MRMNRRARITHHSRLPFTLSRLLLYTTVPCGRMILLVDNYSPLRLPKSCKTFANPDMGNGKMTTRLYAGFFGANPSNWRRMSISGQKRMDMLGRFVQSTNYIREKMSMGWVFRVRMKSFYGEPFKFCRTRGSVPSLKAIRPRKMVSSSFNKRLVTIRLLILCICVANKSKDNK